MNTYAVEFLKIMQGSARKISGPFFPIHQHSLIIGPLWATGVWAMARHLENGRAQRPTGYFDVDVKDLEKVHGMGVLQEPTLRPPSADKPAHPTQRGGVARA